MEVKEIYEKKTQRMPKEQFDDLIKKMRKEHEKLVKGKFEFIDAQGGFLEFTIRLFPGEPIRMIKINHGEVCDLPLGIVKHLNNTRKKIRRQSTILGPRGVPETCEYISRCRFTPVDMM